MPRPSWLLGTHKLWGLSHLSILVLLVLPDSAGQWTAEEGSSPSTRDQFRSSPLLTLKQNCCPREPNWTFARFPEHFFKWLLYVRYLHQKRGKDYIILLLDSEQGLGLRFYPASCCLKQGQQDRAAWQQQCCLRKGSKTSAWNVVFVPPDPVCFPCELPMCLTCIQ